MKLILYVLALHANAANFSSLANPMKMYAEQSTCASQENAQCFDQTDCPMDECSVTMVDDLSKPKFLKRNVQACVADDCKSDLANLVCTDGHGIIAADLTSVYCAVPNGYEQRPADTLTRDAAKTKAKQDAAALASAREAKVREGLRRQEVGSRIIALISQNNHEKNLTNEQAVQLTQALAPIIGQLQTGSIPSAKNLVQSLKPSGVITQADIDLALSQFAAEGF